MDQDELDAAVEAFDKLGIEVIFLERELPKQTLLTSKPKLVCQLALNFLSPYPYLVQKHLSTELLESVKRYAASTEVDLVHFEWTPYAAAALNGTTKPWVADAHNVESLIWKRYFLNEPNFLKRWYIRNQWKKFDRFEKRIFQNASEMVFVSPPDCLIAEDEFACRRGHVVDNGVDLEFFQPTTNERNPREILFLGSLDWRPNLDGVELMLDQVMSQVLEQDSDIQFTVVGRKPPAWLEQRIASCAGAKLYCDVPDVRPFLQRCGMLVVPLRIGGGSRLKILEALASGTPVVSTAVGAEGLDIQPNEHYRPIENVDEIAQVILRSISSHQDLLEMAGRGRTAILKKYDWKVLSKRLESVWISSMQVADNR